MQITQDSRSALSRARFFLDRAVALSPEERVEFEAFLEASIVFGRATVHRFQSRYEEHPNWKLWWASILNDSAVQFFRTERDWILKEGPPKVGQKVFVPTISLEASATYTPSSAGELYYFDDPATPATDTVGHHLDHLAQLLEDAEARFV